MQLHFPRQIVLAAFAALAWTGLAAGARGETALAAVAANFAGPAQELAERFRAESGHEIVVTTGSTGKLYAQIGAGAPYDLLLAADQASPARLLAEGKAVAGSAFTYARGRLVLWSMQPGRATGPEALADPGLRYLAIANPELAPYGAAARQALSALGLWDRLKGRIAIGQNAGQTLAMVASGGAEMGLVALSGVLGRGGSRWEVPQALYPPIRQDAVLLLHGAENAAAKEFLAYLASPAVAQVIAGFGYGGGG